MKTLAITTDFGDQLAPAQLRAVVATLGFEGNIIENHSITPFSILEGAYAIALIARFTPHDTVHLGVIDPGVGSSRKGLVIKTKNSWFVGPDNGLLYPATSTDTIEDAWHIQEDFFGEDVSNTFHGRDIFIKAAVYLAQGKNPVDFGCIPTDLYTLIPLEFQAGQVVHIDDYGDVKIYWPHEIPIGKKFVLSHNGEEFEIPVVKTFSDVSVGEPLVLRSSSGTLELAINLGNAAKYFEVHVGDHMSIRNKTEATVQ